VRLIATDYGFDEIDACTLPSQAGRIRLENVGDPKYAMGVRQF
jgi:amidase